MPLFLCIKFTVFIGFIVCPLVGLILLTRHTATIRVENSGSCVYRKVQLYEPTSSVPLSQHTAIFGCFDVLLTVHLSIILVSDQLNAQILIS